MEEKKDETAVFQNNSAIQAVLIMAIPTIISQMIGFVLFIRDAETIRYATQFIRRLCLSVPLYAVTITINSFFQAVNKPKHAFAISVIRKGIFDLPLMVLFDSLFVVTSIIWVQPIMDLVAVV